MKYLKSEHGAIFVNRVSDTHQVSICIGQIQTDITFEFVHKSSVKYVEATKLEVETAWKEALTKITGQMFPNEYNPDINLTDNMTEKDLENELHRQAGLYGN